MKIKELFSKLFNAKMLDYLNEEIAEYQFEFEQISIDELNEYLDDVANRLVNNLYIKSGPERKNQWEEGWDTKGVLNDNQFSKLPIPVYFEKNDAIRINGSLYNTKQKYVELYFLKALQSILIGYYSDKFECKIIAEYGCGTGHNLEYLLGHGFNKNQLYGYDWASSAINRLKNSDILNGKNFEVVDYFEESTYNSPKEPFIAFTCASLEQTGTNYKKFIKYLIDNPYCIGAVHIEPIWELVPPTNKERVLSRLYCQSRNYLTGFSDFIKFYEMQEKLEIQYSDVNGLGSKYIEGYVPIVWKKIKKYE